MAEGNLDIMFEIGVAGNTIDNCLNILLLLLILPPTYWCPYDFCDLKVTMI